MSEGGREGERRKVGRELHITCSLIFWKQSSTGTLGMLWILLRDTRHTGYSLCFRATLAKWMIALAKWCTITIAWLFYRGEGRQP